jgi:hypothetical protein
MYSYRSIHGRAKGSLALEHPFFIKVTLHVPPKIIQLLRLFVLLDAFLASTAQAVIGASIAMKLVKCLVL